MKIIKIDGYSEAEKFLVSNFSSPTHWPDWNLVVSKFYETDFYYLAAYDGENVIGIMPVHEKQNSLVKSMYSGQYCYIPNGGWIFSRPTTFDLAVLASSITSSLSVNCLPCLPEFNAVYQGETRSRETLVVKLDQDLDQIWNKSIHSKRRNMIRKAEKNGVLIKSLDDTSLDKFYLYYQKANERNEILVQPFEFFEELMNSARNIKFEILQAYYQDEAIGTIVVAYDKCYAFYWLGITHYDVPQLGQGELLQWEAIQHTKRYGCKYYDLCYVDKAALPHIYRFKSGISKTSAEIASYSKKSITFKVLNKAFS